MAETPQSLYELWLKTIPAFFGAMMPPGARASTAQAGEGAEAGTALPFPADQVAKALGFTNSALGQLYQSYLPMLQQGGLSADALRQMASSNAENLRRYAEALNSYARSWSELSGVKLPAIPWGSWPGPLVADNGDGQATALSPLRVGMERTFGGLIDAFGLRAARELTDAWREIVAAALARQQAQAEYLMVVGTAWGKGIELLLGQLRAMGERGESVDSLLAFVRLWAKSADEAMHEAMQSEQGLKAAAKAVSATTRYRQHLHKAAALVGDALNLPTRDDLDEAYREIQELKRELRRLKRSIGEPNEKARAEKTRKETKR